MVAQYSLDKLQGCCQYSCKGEYWDLSTAFEEFYIVSDILHSFQCYYIKIILFLHD